MAGDTEDLAARVSGEAYQVIGCLAAAAGLFDHPEVQRALDYFGHDQWREAGTEILPWGHSLPKAPKDADPGT